MMMFRNFAKGQLLVNEDGTSQSLGATLKARMIPWAQSQSLTDHSTSRGEATATLIGARHSTLYKKMNEHMEG